ncbi:MAG: hypothetical protein ACC608_07005 [Anaerofustis sp.]
MTYILGSISTLGMIGLAVLAAGLVALITAYAYDRFSHKMAEYAEIAKKRKEPFDSEEEEEFLHRVSDPAA